MEPIPLSSWNPESRREPRVRVGMVLPTDRFIELRVTLTGSPFKATADSPARDNTIEPGVDVQISRRDHGLVIRCGGQEWKSKNFTLQPRDAAGGRLIYRQLRAGRGFHWERRCDQEVPGSLEVRSLSEGLLAIADVPLERYLLGVITSEMSGQCPVELLKAQGVAARSWLLAASERKHEALGFDYCNDDCCQRFQGLSEAGAEARRAIEETRGQVLRSGDGGIVDANYAKNCGGISEEPTVVWGVDKPGQYAAVDALAGSTAHAFFPVTEANLAEFLSGQWLATCDCYCGPHRVPDEAIGRYLGRVDDGRGYFRWDVHHDADELTALLGRRLPMFSGGTALDRDAGVKSGLGGQSGPMPVFEPLKGDRLDELVATRRGVSGRAIEMVVRWLDQRGNARERVVSGQYAIRGVLSESFLFSSCVAFEHRRDDRGRLESVTLRGAGWGHGAGLCQIGALGRALAGQDYRTILHHYFRNVRIDALY